MCKKHNGEKPKTRKGKGNETKRRVRIHRLAKLIQGSFRLVQRK